MTRYAKKAKSMSESSNNTDKSYVHEGIEVVLTGRVAKKEKKRPVTRRTATAVVNQDGLIHEITPKDKEIGSWKKWVKMTDLFEIVQ